MTQPHPTPAAKRLDDIAAAVARHIGDARQMWAEIPAHTRRSFGAVVVFVVGLGVAIMCASAVYTFWTVTAGPVVWDAAHGQRDAITTVNAVVAAVIVFAVIVRSVDKAAGRVIADDTRRHGGASGGPVLGAMAGSATGAMAGAHGGVIVGGAAHGAMAGGTAGMMRPPRAAYDPTATSTPAPEPHHPITHDDKDTQQ